MTKEELEREAEEKYVERLKQNGIETEYRNQTYNDGYIDGALPREKQIQALGERCLQLQKDKGKLIDRVRELETQIEKMKCCFNCSRFDTCSLHRPCRNYNEWKLRR